MKNVLDQKPDAKLAGRLLASVNFVQDKDIEGKKVLDVGCGYGWCELNFLKRGVKKIYGIEVTESDLKTARNNISDGRAVFEVGTAIELPFADNYFDTVVCWEVIEHIQKNTEKKMFAEVGRVLKPGGTFYLSTPYDSFLSKTLDPAWWLIGHRHYSRKQLADYAAQQGFEITELQLKGRLWTLLNMDNMYIAKWIFRRKPFFQNFFDRKQGFEYRQGQGFATIFAKFRKLP